MAPIRALLLAGVFVATAAGAAAPELALDPALERMGAQEAATDFRSNPRWRAPAKVLLLAWGYGGLDAQVDALRAAVPGVRLVAATDMAEALREAPDADAIVGFNPLICDPQLLEAARELRFLQSLSTGVEHCLDVPAVQRPDMVVSNARGVDAPAIAEHAISLMLAIAHGMDVFARDNLRTVWDRESQRDMQMQVLTGKTLLITGLGSIGTQVAWRAAGLGMRVVATREGDGPRPDFVSYIGQPGEMLELARTADVVVNCLPLTPATKELFGAEFFAIVKPSLLFVNVARGESVVNEELIRALDERRIEAAGLDAVDPEPLPADHPLWQARRVFITPHIASATDLPTEERWLLLTENLRRYIAGGRVLQPVDVRRGY